MLKDNLEIILITYNRQKHLQRTLEQILAPNSPVRDIDITILDNKSTDGSSELIAAYAQRHPNIKHVRHNINIGGVANSIRAFEGAQKKYVWVLCDDDRYDWSNWAEVEAAMAHDEDLICIARYTLSEENKNKPENQIFQLTFIPAGIYKNSNITEGAIRNAYDNIHSLLPQTCFVVALLNAGKKIYVVDKPIVDRSQLEPIDESYTRGYKPEELSQKTRTMSWIVGYSNVCSMLKDENLKYRTLKIAIDYKDIHGGFDNFCDFISFNYPDKQSWLHVLTVFMQLDPVSQRILLQRFMRHQTDVLSDEKVLYDYFLQFGSDYDNLFVIPDGQTAYSKKTYTMKLDNGTNRIISVFDTVAKA